MNNPLLPAAQRTPYLVNRTKELRQIHQAVYDAPQDTCQIVLIRGKGGMGKSRLVEEVLWRGGNWRTRKPENRGAVPVKQPEWDWTNHGNAVFGDLIDMATPQLYARVQFMQAIRDALVGAGGNIKFPHYDTAFNQFQSQQFYMGDYGYIQALEQTAEEAFIQDFQANAEIQHIVLILDTVERLFPIGGTQWLLERGLLTAADMAFYTYQWLIGHIRQGTFCNTTLLLAGRGKEGTAFFDAIEKAAGENPKSTIHRLEIGPFSLEDTKAFLEVLADIPIDGETDQIVSHEVAETILNIAADEARVETLHTYTGGQPVRLSLYTDLIVDAQRIPERLQDTPEAAKRAEQEGTLESIQEEIEASFIHLLFSRPSQGSEILKALVRAPRGLDVEQFQYALLSKPKEPPADWLERARTERALDDSRKDIQKALDALKRLSIVKRRPDGRIGLQDEIYRIYTHHLSKSDKTCLAEQEARQKFYEKLEAWAHYHHEKRLKELTETQAEDERRLNITVPSRVRKDVQFPDLTETERNNRSQLRAEIGKWELESLHYALLRDFVRNFNHVAFEQADQKWIASNPGSEALIQAELWQVLKERSYALKEFGKLEPWLSLRVHGEPTLHALERVALQEDITNWIKRFALRKTYQRALEFYEALEKVLKETYPLDSKKREERSWHHTFSRGQRELWRDYARLMTSTEVEKTLRGMETTLQNLEALLGHNQDEIALEDRGEKGFLGHPAELKLKRVIALYYNYIGYGYATLGSFRQATGYYSRALTQMRETEFPHMAPTTANNLSRVLSDRGYSRSRRICLDALELRKKQGAEVPIAYSYNTLALIDNDHNRPDLAWVEAAIAIAYFRMANDPRGLGLSLLQLGEALRRLAKPTSEAHHLRGDKPELILEIAQQTLDEAVNIFVKHEELLRRVEAWIERGCLERDRIQWSKDPARRERHYRDAFNSLEQAVQLAQEIHNKRLELDACVNIGWTHYYFDDLETTLESLESAEKIVPADYRIREGENLPLPDRDGLYNYQQLAKLNGLRGRVAMDRFGKRVDAIKAIYPEEDAQQRRERIHLDSEAGDHLHDAVEHYTLALAYAQLLSPRSSALSMIYNSLYGYLKGFNLTEMADFSRYAVEQRQRYQIDQLRTTDLGKLHEFLVDSFGFSEGVQS
ncbi:MAG: ATP-binding protein [Chloroflexi bacterium]|nr:ATP-binding protein [Chloroflexota bacterium]